MIYAIYMVAIALVMIILYPKNMNQFVNANPFYFDFAGYISAMLRILISSVIMFFLSMLFFSGYGNMITEAIKQEKTSVSSFLPGIQKYFVRVLLSFLLLTAFAIGASIVLSIILIPITLFAAIGGMFIGIIASLVSIILMALVIPFILLWFPAIFIDDVGVIQSMKNGAKAGTKNYGKLILLIFVMYAPALIYMQVEQDAIMQGMIMTPGYYAIYILSAILCAVLLPMLFIIYDDSKAL
jgi:hypothetical protein